MQADQAELVGREVEQCPLAEVSTTTVPFADEQRDTHPCVRPNLAEALSRVPILEVPDPTAQELVDVPHDRFNREQESDNELTTEDQPPTRSTSCLLGAPERLIGQP
jgi:hypothetical protein